MSGAREGAARIGMTVLSGQEGLWPQFRAALTLLYGKVKCLPAACWIWKQETSAAFPCEALQKLCAVAERAA